MLGTSELKRCNSSVYWLSFSTRAFACVCTLDSVWL